jgi:tetratricopeptide (TPR) repeat protein
MQAANYFESLIEQVPQHSVFARLFLADFYNDIGNPELARMQKEQWRHSATYQRELFRGNDHLHAGDITNAIHCYHLAILDYPTYSVAYSNLSDCYRRLGMLDSAVTYAEISMALNPYDGINMFKLGLAYFQMGKRDAAEHWWQKSMSADPELAGPVAFLLISYHETSRAEREQKLLDYLSERPELRDKALNMAVRYYLDEGDTATARLFLAPPP